LSWAAVDLNSYELEIYDWIKSHCLVDYNRYISLGDRVVFDKLIELGLVRIKIVNAKKYILYNDLDYIVRNKVESK
jgi:hypothetical protein